MLKPCKVLSSAHLFIRQLMLPVALLVENKRSGACWRLLIGLTASCCNYQLTFFSTKEKISQKGPRLRWFSSAKNLFTFQMFLFFFLYKKEKNHFALRLITCKKPPYLVLTPLMVVLCRHWGRNWWFSICFQMGCGACICLWEGERGYFSSLWFCFSQ